MEKVNKQSKNNYEEIIQELKGIYPPLFKDEGNLDEEELRSLMKNFASTSEGKYEFNWAGKMNAKRNAFTTSKAMLKPDKDRSIDFNNTKNLIVEGDNLEVLKLLQKSYQDTIKCIYIDPPYNTGNDFIYSDDFSEDKQAYWEKTGVTKDGVKLDTNTESNGRYHSDWLNMMYPRLLLARNLLTDDGVIFVSIDDNEVHNLRKIMDEIFGEENFIVSILWKRKKEKSNDVKGFAIQGEYILAYSKSDKFESPKEDLSEDYIASSYSIDDEGHYWRPVPITVDAGHKGGGYEYEIETPSGKKYTRIWRLPQKSYRDLLENGNIYFGKNEGSIPQRIKHLDNESGTYPSNYWSDIATNKEGKKEVLELFGFEIFDTVKPTKLIKRLFKLASSKESIILDFFAGSGTTAQAVMELNKEDGGNRKYILVQIPEETDEKSEAYKNGYKTISDICIERVKRVSKKLEREEKEKLIKENENLDLGFKVFTLSKSYFPENLFVLDPDKTEEENKEKLGKYLKDVSKQLDFDFNEFDLMYEVLLKDGFNLNFEVEKLFEFAKNNVYKVTDGEKEAYITLDSELKEDTLQKLQKYTDNRFLCLERALNTTKKWNLQNMFKNNLWVI